VAHVERHLAAAEDPDDALAGLHVGDLYLACALARGDTAALQRFECEVLPAATPALRRIDASADFAEEVRQKLRLRLLVADGGPPKIVDYAGRGPLAAWVRVAAVRTGLNMRATRQVALITSDGVAAHLPAQADPQLDYLRAEYAQEFTAALENACRKLTSRQRAVLRFKLVDGLNIDDIGEIYGVHRATVARWVQSAWDEIFAETRRQLREQLKLSTEEFESLVELVRSRLDVSVGQLLRTRRTRPPSLSDD
jgi:RNA polymerase sigma-70 factor (ECF subfamily)